MVATIAKSTLLGLMLGAALAFATSPAVPIDRGGMGGLSQSLSKPTRLPLPAL